MKQTLWEVARPAFWHPPTLHLFVKRLSVKQANSEAMSHKQTFITPLRTSHDTSHNCTASVCGPHRVILHWRLGRKESLNDQSHSVIVFGVSMARAGGRITVEKQQYLSIQNKQNNWIEQSPETSIRWWVWGEFIVFTQSTFGLPICFHQEKMTQAGPWIWPRVTHAIKQRWGPGSQPLTAPRTIEQKVLKFGTLIGDSPLTLVTKFHICTHWGIIGLIWSRRVCDGRGTTAQVQHIPAPYYQPLTHTTDCTDFHKVGTIYLNELSWCTNGVSLNKVIGLPTGWEFVLS